MQNLRSHYLRELNKSHIGQKVNLSGWVHRRRDHGGLIFIDLRDRFGLTQLVFDPEKNEAAHTLASSLRSEWVIQISGEVIPRKEGMINPNLKTGEIEIDVESLNVLSASKTPPFSICDETTTTNEDLRLRYRYLDMRRGKITDNLVLRHKVMQKIRNFFSSENFIEVTTPVLGKSTPEGARDYLVPSRVYPGNFFALPQSPQIFKQLLMLGGLDRYFQIAQCFRDEDIRSDRQPEFTQLDLEMSFGNPEYLQGLIEKFLKELLKETINVSISGSFKRLSYKDCLERYGSDKPDLRFDMQLVRIDDIAKDSNFTVFKEKVENGGCVKAICVKSGSDISRKEIDRYTAFVAPFGVKGLGYMKMTDGKLTSTITKFFSEEQLVEIAKRTSAQDGDLIFFAAEEEKVVNQALDHLRRLLAKERNLIKEDQYVFLWVTDFPLFEWDFETNRPCAVHHLFTAPHPDDTDKLESHPLEVRSVAYDIVLNGYEIGGGSQRIHNQELQEKIFNLLKLSKDDIENRFGFFNEALKYGCPPHLGIAFGIDRIIMILAKTENIRDVIAFPKTQKASDLMMHCPSNVDPSQLKDLDITTSPTEIYWNT